MGKLDDQIAQDRKNVTAGGDQTQAENRQRANVARQRRVPMMEQMQEAYDPMIGGRGGYNPQEAGDIRGEYGGLQTTPEEFQSNQFTGQEQQDIRGNPWARAAYYDPESDMARTYESSGRVRGAVDQYGNDIDRYGNELTQSIDENGLSIDPRYKEMQDATIMQTGGDIRKSVDPALLRADQQALEDIRMDPEEQQRMITGAGITAGLGYSQATDDAMRRGRAAGMNPMGLAAVRGRNENQSAVAKGNAMTLARIAAGDALARRAGQAEDYRMRGEESAADRMGRAARHAGELGYGSRSGLEDQRLGAARDLSGRKLQAATTKLGAAGDLGRTRVGAEEGSAGREQQSRQYNTSMGTDIATGIERDEQARAAGLAENRQKTNFANQATRFGQGMDVQQAKRQGAETVANKRLGQQETALGWKERQEAAARDEEEGGYDREQRAYEFKTGAQDQATQNQLRRDERVRGWEKVGGMVVGGLGAAAGAGLLGGAASAGTKAASAATTGARAAQGAAGLGNASRKVLQR